jgi:hypothetical protein
MKPELPLYKCHKLVRALKIESIGPDAQVAFEDTSYSPIKLDERLSQRFPLNVNDEAAGYYVVYEDGYVSWSPTKAFEAGYALVK